jgi:hypothetical protein
LEKIVLKHYEYDVLKPELSDSEINQLYQDALNSIHISYLRVIADMDDDFQMFIAKHTSYLDSSPSIPSLTLDWTATIYKVRIAPDAEFTLGGLRSITFGTVGGMIGKSLGLAFVNRAMMTVAGGTVGTGVGPVGTVIGAAGGATVGMMMDWLIHQGNESLSRSQFEREILESVNAAKETIKNKMLPSLLDTVNVQYDDLVQLLLKQ